MRLYTHCVTRNCATNKELCYKDHSLTLPSRFQVNRACDRDRWSHSCNAWAPVSQTSRNSLCPKFLRCSPEPFIPILRITPRSSVSHSVPYAVGNSVAEVIESTVRWLCNGCCKYCHRGQWRCVLHCRCWSVILDHWSKCCVSCCTLHFADSTASFEVDGCGEAIGVSGVFCTFLRVLRICNAEGLCVPTVWCVGLCCYASWLKSVKSAPRKFKARPNLVSFSRIMALVMRSAGLSRVDTLRTRRRPVLSLSCTASIFNSTCFHSARPSSLAHRKRAP